MQTYSQGYNGIIFKVEFQTAKPRIITVQPALWSDYYVK